MSYGYDHGEDELVRKERNKERWQAIFGYAVALVLFYIGIMFLAFIHAGLGGGPVG